jgi:hypothetical protein
LTANTHIVHFKRQLNMVSEDRTGLILTRILYYNPANLRSLPLSCGSRVVRDRIRLTTEPRSPIIIKRDVGEMTKVRRHLPVSSWRESCGDSPTCRTRRAGDAPRAAGDLEAVIVSNIRVSPRRSDVQERCSTTVAVFVKP